MTIENKIIIWLNKFEFLTYNKQVNIFEKLNSDGFFQDFLYSYNKIEDIISYKDFALMQADIKNEKVDDYINSILKNNIKIITILDNNYPEKLKNIDNPPRVLYLKGNSNLLYENNNIAIVGTRHPTNYGKTVTELFSSELTKNNFNIVSGMADGVDTIAHTNCLKNGGKTIAVLAGGLYHIYPALNKKLSEEVEKEGLLLTDKAPDYVAKPYDFPKRNRIIAGISEGVLITEASSKSGTMHTKEYAINYGKELFVVPGNITSEKSNGCNKLIKDIHSIMVTEVDDILKNFKKHNINKTNVKQEIQLSIDDAIIYELLKQGELSFDEILIKTNFDTKYLNNLLTMLTFRGIIKKLAGNIYSV